ncbi:hypothetical protein ACIQXU_20740 [Peribacillus sp. NPDC097284]|uniref:hypothetical protein n=1 Tax=Peribacillus sp. NPDC097284 TaxID=3364401 RepID=UPI00381AD0F1
MTERQAVVTKTVSMVYKASDVMGKLGLKDSAFKKYIYLLEKEGYLIKRNNKGHRIFTEDNIKTLEMFLELSRYDGVTLESVAKKVAEMNHHNGMTESKPESHDGMTLISTLLKEQQQQFEIQRLKQEEQFAERMQKVLESQLKLQERTLKAELTVKLSKIEESNKRIEEHLITKKKQWWRFWE